MLTSLLGERHEGSLARVVAGVLTHVQEGSVLDVLVAAKLPALVKAVCGLAKALLGISNPHPNPNPNLNPNPNPNPDLNPNPNPNPPGEHAASRPPPAPAPT